MHAPLDTLIVWELPVQVHTHICYTKELFAKCLCNHLRPHRELSLPSSMEQEKKVGPKRSHFLRGPLVNGCRDGKLSPQVSRSTAWRPT